VLPFVGVCAPEPCTGWTGLPEVRLNGGGISDTIAFDGPPPMKEFGAGTGVRLGAASGTGVGAGGGTGVGVGSSASYPRSAPSGDSSDSEYSWGTVTDSDDSDEDMTGERGLDRTKQPLGPLGLWTERNKYVLYVDASWTG
jgi:hypothetical protein